MNRKVAVLDVVFVFIISVILALFNTFLLQKFLNNCGVDITYWGTFPGGLLLGGFYAQRNVGKS